MKTMTFTQKMMVLCISFIIFSSCIMSRISYAKDYTFKWSNHKQVEITAYRLNIRCGPSTKYAKVGWLQRGDVVNVLGSLGSWYVIQTDNDLVGSISSTYTRVVSTHNTAETQTKEPQQVETLKETTPQTNETPSTSDEYSFNLTENEQEMLNLINSERTKNGLTPFEVDQSVMRIARIKAEDLVDNQYFSHQSPIYGSPFDMLKDFQITYQVAGENIAGNSTVFKAHTSLMYSPGHRNNILSPEFNKIGTGIVDDPRYGKVFVQIFIKE